MALPDQAVAIEQSASLPSAPSSTVVSKAEKALLQEQHLTFQENQKGISYDGLFGPYLKDARSLTITDPYIRLFFQARNLMELLEIIAKNKPADEEVTINLVTVADEFRQEQQDEWFNKIQESAASVGIQFTWEFDQTGTLHARHIITDHGWKISLDRGLDIFQQYDMNDAFSFANRMQQFRLCKAFEVTFIKSS